MSIKLINFKDMEEKAWNEFLLCMKGNLHYASWHVIKYLSAFQNVENFSFCLMDGKICLAMVPLGMVNRGKEDCFLGFGGDYCTTPVTNNRLTNYERRKILTVVRAQIDEIGKKNKLKLYKFKNHPLIYNSKLQPILSSINQFDHLRWSKKFLVHNTIIIDLGKSEQVIWDNFSKYHKKNIKKILKKNLKFEIVSSDKDKSTIENKFRNFKKAHFQSAGRSTRPDETWNIMQDMIFKDKSVLFCISHNQVEISYLYCGFFNNFAWGWSQVNLDKYEKEFMPRHLLEWLVIKYFKDKKFSFYEIGERFFSYEGFKPSKKEITISEFKEKFGGEMYPSVYFQSTIN